MTHTSSAFLTMSAVGLAALIAAGAATPASAQTTPATPPAASPAAAAPAPVASRTEQRHLTQLHQQLKITSSEEGAWKQFAAVSMQNADQLDSAFRERAGQLQSMNAVENMQSFAKLDMQRAQDMQQLVPAFQQLYAALSPAQQQAADQMFRDSGERHAARVAAHR